MPEYRAYSIDSDGHFVGFEPLICADDAEAITQARHMLDSKDIELWSGPTLVIRLDHSRK
jgi:hypothetical protein